MQDAPSLNQQSLNRQHFLAKHKLDAKDIAAYTFELQRMSRILKDQIQLKLISFLHCWAPELKKVPHDKLQEYLESKKAIFIAGNYDKDPIAGWSRLTYILEWKDEAHDIKRAVEVRSRCIGSGRTKKFTLTDGTQKLAYEKQKLEVEAKEIPVPPTLTSYVPKQQEAAANG